MSEGQAAIQPKHLPTRNETWVETLGEATIPSPLSARAQKFVPETNRVLAVSEMRNVAPLIKKGEDIPSFEQAGPRDTLFFSPDKISCGIVTCGGLCPGLNDVVRSIVLTLRQGYGVKRILGFRYGYSGLSAGREEDPVFLEPEMLKTAHQHGGSWLGSSRGHQDLSEMVDTLVKWKVDILFTVGGDGTLRGAKALCNEIKERNLKISVIGVPKTIDNDLMWIERSFGFATAVQEAQRAVDAAHTEAECAWNGIGLVKLMGRHSGFIAASATLTSADVDFCLVPEVPFTLEGTGGLFDHLERCLFEKHHAAIVVAEGAGQELIKQAGEESRDASGNVKLKDIGLFLKERIGQHFKAKGTDFTIKYIDPSYIIRSLPANSMDSAFCLILGQHAAHAGLSGKTNMMVGFWNHRFTHVPLALAVGMRKQLDPHGEVWQRVLDSTFQPASLVGE